MPLLHVLRLGRELVILVYGMAVVASFTFLGQELYRSALWHQPFVLLLTLGAALAALAAWSQFQVDRTSQSFLLFAAFAALAVLYAPHALLEAATFDPAHLAFGPLSRFTFAVGLIAAAVGIPIPAFHRLPRWLLVCLIVVAGGLIDVLIHSAAATRLWQANPVGFLRRVEGLALAGQLLAVSWVVGLWWRRRRPFLMSLAGGVMALATGSVLFLTTIPWQGRWWVAHLGLFVCAVIIGVGIVEERARRGALAGTFDLDGTAQLAEHVVAAMRDGLALHDQHDRLVGWNPAALAITGWTRDLAAERWAANLPDGLVDLGEGKWVEARRITLRRYGRDYTATLFTDARTQMALREAQAFLEHLIAASPVVIFRGDPHDLRLSYMSPNIEPLLGYALPDVVGAPDFWAAHLHPEDLHRFQTALARALADGAEQLELEYRFRHRDGDYRTLYMVARLEYAEDGRPLNALGYALDITARKAAEQQVVERTVALEAANRELEDFSYAVSHDLRAPIRSIDGFSRVLLEDYADRLDAEGHDAIQRIHRATQRMTDLIDALLELSRVTRAKLHWERVDLSALVESIIAELQQMQPDRRVEFRIANGLAAHGDARLLRLALDNLLGNAWKFTGKQPRARIEFGVTAHDDRPAYFVRDNGAGFDAAYADKLFVTFQRLHSATAFPGTGIGLATVRRIIHRHGGRIWAEGAVDQGATFYFTLGDSASKM
jgi:PAS domain S-box-containing protein